MRATKSDAREAFERLVSAVGGREATGPLDVGGYLLDYNPVYGGYTIEQITRETGATKCPFGYRRMKAAEFVAACGFAIEVRKIQEG
jgi:hypothetical protein